MLGKECPLAEVGVVQVMSLKIFPYFQPIVETATGRIAGYEALARMEDAAGNIVSAGSVFSDDKIPVQERIESIFAELDAGKSGAGSGGGVWMGGRG